jgi:hypothetical protein
MTPRDKSHEIIASQREFSQKIFSDISRSRNVFHLDGNSGLYYYSHPALLKENESELTGNPNVALSKIQNWHFASYSSLAEALSQHPNIPVFGGFPKDIFNYLKQQPQIALVDFQILGTVILSRDMDLSDRIKWDGYAKLYHFTSYALSQELWSIHGKWSRFHLSLHALFQKYQLLAAPDSPGYYPLHLSMVKLEKYGFKGLEKSSSYELILPWDFPLSGLRKLESIIVRGA